MEIAVRAGEGEVVVRALVHAVHAVAQRLNVLLAEHIERLAHVAQLQHPPDAEHLVHGLALAADIEEQHVLEHKVEAEFLDLRAASGAGLHHAHQLHALDRLAKHVPGDAEHLAHLQLRGQQIAGLQFVADDIAANLPERLNVELVLFLNGFHHPPLHRILCMIFAHTL